LSQPTLSLITGTQLSKFSVKRSADPTEAELGMEGSYLWFIGFCITQL